MAWWIAHGSKIEFFADCLADDPDELRNPLHTKPELDAAVDAIVGAILDLHSSRHIAVGMQGGYPLAISAADVWALYQMRPLPCTAARFFELVRRCDSAFLDETYARLNSQNGHRTTRR